jgi:hypothetical protein
LRLHDSKAGTSFEFLFEKDRVNDDRQFFLHMAVTDSGFRRAAIEPVLPRIHVDEDLTVVLFLARESRTPLDVIVRLRSRGLSWSTISRRIRLPHDVLFVGIDQDPGPPYGAAWGRWKQRHGGTLVLSDRDFTGLVQIQMAHRITGGSCYDIARGWGRGEPAAVYVSKNKGWRKHDGLDDEMHGHGKGKRPHHENGKNPHDSDDQD